MVDDTDAAAAEAPVTPVETKAIQTWTCDHLLLEWGTHSGVSAESASRGIEDRTASVVLICRARGETSLSVERLHVDLQLSRSTCHCLHAFSFSYLLLTAFRDFLDMTKRPLSVSPSSKWEEIFCSSPLGLLCPVHGTMIQCSTLCTQRKVTKFPCFWCLVFGAQFQHFLECFLAIFFAMQLALVSMITVTLISSLSVFSLQRTRRFRTRGDL